MTNTEAIRILTLERDDWETSHCTPMERKEAFEMAINALTKEAWKEEHPVSPLLDLQPCKQDDLIGRAAAIEVLGFFTQVDTLGHTPKQIVEALPSAQPEIVRCKDCKYWQDQQEGVVEVPICARPENKYEKLPFRFMIEEDGFCSFAERRTE